MENKNRINEKQNTSPSKNISQLPTLTKPRSAKKISYIRTHKTFHQFINFPLPKPPTQAPFPKSLYVPIPLRYCFQESSAIPDIRIFFPRKLLVIQYLRMTQYIFPMAYLLSDHPPNNKVASSFFSATYPGIERATSNTLNISCIGSSPL